MSRKTINETKQNEKQNAIELLKKRLDYYLIISLKKECSYFFSKQDRSRLRTSISRFGN
jgi:hypothetical protein